MNEIQVLGISGTILTEEKGKICRETCLSAIFPQKSHMRILEIEPESLR
jgi:hypothetical protein